MTFQSGWACIYTWSSIRGWKLIWWSRTFPLLNHNMSPLYSSNCHLLRLSSSVFHFDISFFCNRSIIAETSLNHCGSDTFTPEFHLQFILWLLRRLCAYLISIPLTYYCWLFMNKKMKINVLQWLKSSYACNVKHRGIHAKKSPIIHLSYMVLHDEQSFQIQFKVLFSL